MRFLLDSHVLLWAAYEPRRLSKASRDLLSDPAHELCFSSVSIWEIAIKVGLKKSELASSVGALRRGLLVNGYTEVSLTSEHALAVEGLPHIHRDPFDRILIAQALVESLTFLTSDRTLLKYPGAIQKV